MRVIACLVLAAFLCVVPAKGQIVTSGAQTGGVAISPDGVLQYRQVAPIALPTAANRKPAQQLYVSLPRAIGEWKAAKQAGKEVPPEVRYMHGLTQIRNVFVFPEQHDIVVAGPSEPFNAANKLAPLGTQSGRPVVQLEDLIVTMRAVANGRGSAGFFGCSLEPPANLNEVWDATLKRFGNGPRTVLQAEMKRALGPQDVKLFGVPEDSRLALALVAADYRLKRVAMGLDTVPGLANALGSENAAPRIWFEPSYEPLTMSPDGNAFEFKGPRLKVLVGAQQFNPQGATDTQRRFADNLTKKIPDAAAKIDAFADLQNIVDCFMVAALIRQDDLTAKAGLPADWLPANEAPYTTATVVSPRTAETVVHIAGNVIAQGGVAMQYRAFTDVGREKQEAGKFSTRSDRPVETWFHTAGTGPEQKK